MTGVEEAALAAAVAEGAVATEGAVAAGTAVTAAEAAAAAEASAAAAAAAEAGTVASTAATTAETGGGLLALDSGAMTASEMTPAMLANADAAAAGGYGGFGAVPAAEPVAGGGGLLGGVGYGPQTSGVNEFGINGLNSLSGNSANTQFMTGSATEIGQVGGAGQSLASTTADAAMMAGDGGFALTLDDAMKLAQLGYQGMKAGQQKPQQGGGTRVVSGGDAGTPQRQGQSFAQMAPYASFGGGFNPKKYGANVRKPGLLG